MAHARLDQRGEMSLSSCGSASVKTTKCKFVFSILIFLLCVFSLLLCSFNLAAAQEYTRYLNDSSNDSTAPFTAPWGEIIEVGVSGSWIVVKNKGEMEYSSSLQSAYLFVFFDEDYDNRTDLVFSYTLYYSQLSGSVEEKCYLCRPRNHTYFGGGVWNFSSIRFDGRINYDVIQSQFSFELGGALKGTLRLKMASYYTYSLGSRSYKGGDFVPNSIWDPSQVILSPSQIDNIDRLLNDSRLDYPLNTFSLSEPTPSEPDQSRSFYDLVLDFSLSIQSWIMNNVATAFVLSVFSLAAVYSLAGRLRAYISVVLVYFVVAAMIYASTLQNSLFLPLLFSAALLLPLFLWYYEVSDSLSFILRVKKRLVWVEVFALFSLALAVRLPFSALFSQLPLEKASLPYLVILTIVLIKGNSLGSYGLKTRGLAKSLLVGLAYFLAYGLPFFATIFGLAFMFSGQLALSGYNAYPALIYLPFMILCVGLGEEGLFRGFIQTRLARATNRNTALLVQALLFGIWQLTGLFFVFPLNVMGMTFFVFQTFALGLLFGLFYKISGNLISLVLTSGLINTVLLLTNPFAIYAADPFPSVILGVSISMGLIVQAVFTKRLARSALVKTETDQERS